MTEDQQPMLLRLAAAGLANRVVRLPAGPDGARGLSERAVLAALCEIAEGSVFRAAPWTFAFRSEAPPADIEEGLGCGARAAELRLPGARPAPVEEAGAAVEAPVTGRLEAMLEELSAGLEARDAALSDGLAGLRAAVERPAEEPAPDALAGLVHFGSKLEAMRRDLAGRIDGIGTGAGGGERLEAVQDGIARLAASLGSDAGARLDRLAGGLERTEESLAGLAADLRARLDRLEAREAAAQEAIEARLEAMEAALASSVEVGSRLAGMEAALAASAEVGARLAGMEAGLARLAEAMVPGGERAVADRLDAIEAAAQSGREATRKVLDRMAELLATIAEGVSPPPRTREAVIDGAALRRLSAALGAVDPARAPRLPDLRKAAS